MKHAVSTSPASLSDLAALGGTLPPELQLGEPVTDAVHAEFIQLLQAAAQAGDDTFLAALDAWIDHTRYHFGQEDAWMEAMGFGQRHCHTGEHQQVLAVADAAREKVAKEGDFQTGRRLVAEMPGWFDLHVKQKDAPMVNYMRENGFTLIEAPEEPA